MKTWILNSSLAKVPKVLLSVFLENFFRFILVMRSLYFSPSLGHNVPLNIFPLHRWKILIFFPIWNLQMFFQWNPSPWKIRRKCTRGAVYDFLVDPRSWRYRLSFWTPVNTSWRYRLSFWTPVTMSWPFSEPEFCVIRLWKKPASVWGSFSESSSFVPWLVLNTFWEATGVVPEWPCSRWFMRKSPRRAYAPIVRFSVLLNSFDNLFVILPSISSETWVM